ncbi:sigma-54-dependent transcriptional regulator [Candidatus Margulisiibacteriota bacterium]
METILVVDDEKSVRESLKMILEDNYKVLLASSGKEAIEKLLSEHIDLMLLDIRMPGISGLEVLKQVEKVAKDIEVIIITAHKAVDVAVDALKMGAYHYVTKPFDPQALLSLIQNLIEKKSLLKENISLRSKISKATSLGEVIGQADEMKKVITEINRAIRNDDAVVIYGESGTEKELIAYTIHQQSVRSGSKFITVQCSQKSALQLEKEIFGFEIELGKNSFEKHAGALEESKGGILFLNEVNNLPSSIQEKILMVLQSKRFKRLKGQHDLILSARIISSASIPLRRLVSQGNFNEELYHYLNVLPIDIPPLRQRKKDIPLLVDTLLQRYNQELGHNVSGLSEEALLVLSSYDWPGNIAELESIMEQIITIVKAGQIEVTHLPLGILIAGEGFIKNKDEFSLKNLLKHFKKEQAKKVLRENQDNQMLTALQLKIDVKELEKILKS